MSDAIETSRALRVLNRAAFLPFVWIAFVFIYVCFFAFPQTDDFCTFSRLFNSHDGNPFVESWYLYLNWTGRYSSSFFTAAVGWIAKITPWQLYITYSLSLAGLILLFYFACNAVVQATFGKSRNGNKITLIMYAICLLLMPSKVEGLYWLTGAIVYFASTSALFITIYTIIDSLKQHGEKSFETRTIFPSLTIFVCVGFNEFVAVTLGMWMVLYTSMFLLKNINRKIVSIYLIAYIASLCISILAPGNFKRNAALTGLRHSLSQSVILTLQDIHSFVVERVAPHALLLSIVLAACGVIGYQLSFTERVRANRGFVLPMVLILSFPIALFTYAFLTGQNAPGRIFDQIYPELIIGLCLLSAFVGHALSRREATGGISAAGVTMLLLVGIMSVSSKPMAAVSDVARNFGPTWRTEQIRRNELLWGSTSGDPVVDGFHQGQDPWHVLQGADISTDPSNWINRCVAAYYHLKSVRLSDREADH